MKSEYRQYCDIIAHQQIVLYGIGAQFKESYKLFNKYNLLLCDSDEMKTGKIIDGNVIISPKELREKMIDDSVVVITSIRNQYEIAKFLCEQMQIPKEQVFMYTSKWYEEYVYNVDLIEKNWHRTLACAEKLADAESKNTI